MPALNESMLYGSAVHLGVARYLEASMQVGAKPGVEQLIAGFDEAWSERAGSLHEPWGGIVNRDSALRDLTEFHERQVSSCTGLPALDCLH